ncbi:histidine kinase [Streptosporangium sp. NBC_01755]|uniref:sensor histidine kinase n=1 Tax=Streptosporangium sp. NBC_01755 TaxID=2975949 RepID=UPI002DDBB106|nr:histidine kinase [Streptosporangium sp. NBC_01755]WSD03577.1 histidine kinase [Streptosporangium sp. NBC_01755]
MRRDALVAVACFVVGLLLLAANAYQHRWAAAPLFVGPLAISCVGVLVRRSRPLLSLGLGVVALLGDFAMGPSLGTVLIVTDNLYAGVRYGPRALGRWMLGITSVGAVVMGVIGGALFRHWSAAAVFLVQGGLVGMTPVFTAMIVRQLEDQATSERARAEQVARLAELDRAAAVQAERARMARELHDMIANHFSAIAIQSTAVLSRRDLDAQTVRKVLESIRENSVEGMGEMRAMIGLLRQDGEEPEATRRRVAEAEELAERAREAGLDVRMRVDGDVRELPASVDLAGYRIVQESLTNALRHGGKAADVVIGYLPGLVTLTVDNPVGGARLGPPGAGARLGPPGAGARLGPPGAGAGIIGMRERTNLVGGVFEAGPHNDGWRVRAELPTREVV